jgi:hypothetical protein
VKNARRFQNSISEIHFFQTIIIWYVAVIYAYLFTGVPSGSNTTASYYVMLLSMVHHEQPWINVSKKIGMPAFQVSSRLQHYLFNNCCTQDALA